MELELSTSGGVACLLLNRPGSLNAITLQMARDLEAALEAVSQDPGVGALLLAGAGRAFCAGADLTEMEAHAADRAEYVNELASRVHRCLARLRRLRVPVVAAVGGVAAGGGFSLALSCDLVVAGASSRFVAGYQSVGLTPDAGSTYWLPRMVGVRRAQELLLTGRVLTAPEALAWGLINVVAPDAEVSEMARDWARGLANGPRTSLGATKRLLQSTWQHTFAEQLDAERESVALRAASSEGTEGIRAFLEHRAPRFPS